MGLSQSNLNKVKSKVSKFTNNTKSKVSKFANNTKSKVSKFANNTKICLIKLKKKLGKCWSKFLLLIKFNTRTPEIIVDNVELTGIKNESSDIENINSTLNNQTSLNKYINSDYIRNKSDSNINLDLTHPI
jgi:hypothetical protein